jgi:hypothetical protein
MAISHVFSNAVSDGTNTNIVRPSDWNSVHNQYYTLSGNTLGASTVSGTNVVFQGSGNISLSGTGRTIVIYGTGGGGGGGGAALSAGTQSVSTGTVSFADSNGISFGMAGSNQITASYTVPTQSVQTQASGNIAGAGFTSATTAGTAIVGTNNSLGLSLGIPAYLTAASGGGGVMYANLSGNTSGNTTASGSTLNFSGINITLSGTNGSQIVISAPPTSALTQGNNISISNTGATIGISAQAVAAAAGTQTATSGTVIFSNSNGISFGLNNGTLTASVAAAPTSYVSNVNGSSGQISLNVGSSLSSSTAGSSITFGLASNITTALQSAGAYLTTAAQSSASNLSIAIAATNNTGGGTATLASSISFKNANGLTFYTSAGNAIVASYSVPTVPTSYVSNVNGSSGQISLNVGSSLSSSTAGSSITFGLASNITTALQSAGAYLTTARASNDAVGLNTAGTNVTWTVNSSGISLNAGGYAGTNTSANNASLTLNSNGLTISVAAPGAANYSIGVSNLGNTAGATGITGTRIVFVGTNNISLSQATDANGATISINQTGGGGGAMYANLSGNTSGNTTASGSTLNFSGINITLSGTNNSQIVISAPPVSSLVAGNNISISTNGSTISVLAQAVAIGASTQTATSGTINFVNSNGITFGMSGSNQITASYTQSNQAFSASGGSSTFQTLNFANSNGVTFSNSGGSVVASYTVPATTGFAGTGFTSTTVTGTAVQGTLSTNGLSLAVPAYLTAAAGGGGVAIGASTQTATSGTVNFANSNGISFGMSGSNQITASHNGITTQTVQTQASGAIAGTGFTSTTTAGSVITGALGTNGLNLGVPAYLTTQSVQTQASGNIAGAGFTTATTAGTAIVGTHNSLGLSLGVPAYLTAAGGGGAVNFSAGTTSNNLQTVVFSNSNGVSFGLNGSTITASVAPAYTLSGYNHYNDVVQSIGSVGQGSLIFDPIDLANAVQFDRFGLMLQITNATNSSGSHTLSFWIGVYTQNVDTISLLQSTSTSVNVSQSGTVGSYSLYSGVRKLTIPFTTTLSVGAYWLGVVSRTTSGGANGTYQNLQQSNLNSDYRGIWGSAVNATNQIYKGAGFYSATTSGLPGSVAFSQINGTVGGAFRPPVIIFQSGAV